MDKKAELETPPGITRKALVLSIRAFLFLHDSLARAIVRRFVAAGALGLAVRAAAGVVGIVHFHLYSAHGTFPPVCYRAALGASEIRHSDDQLYIINLLVYSLDYYRPSASSASTKPQP